MEGEAVLPASLGRMRRTTSEEGKPVRIFTGLEWLDWSIARLSPTADPACFDLECGPPVLIHRPMVTKQLAAWKDASAFLQYLKSRKPKHGSHAEEWGGPLFIRVLAQSNGRSSVYTAKCWTQVKKVSDIPPDLAYTQIYWGHRSAQMIIHDAAPDGALPACMHQRNTERSLILFLSLRSTLSGTHRDETTSVLYCVSGVKVIYLAHPDTPEMLKQRSLSDEADFIEYNPFNDPDPSPLWKRVELLPGGSLLIPRGWWHNVFSTAGQHGCMPLVKRGCIGLSMEVTKAATLGDMSQRRLDLMQEVEQGIGVPSAVLDVKRDQAGVTMAPPLPSKDLRPLFDALNSLRQKVGVVCCGGGSDVRLGTMDGVGCRGGHVKYHVQFGDGQHEWLSPRALRRQTAAPQPQPGKPSDRAPSECRYTSKAPKIPSTIKTTKNKSALGSTMKTKAKAKNKRAQLSPANRHASDAEVRAAPKPNANIRKRRSQRDQVLFICGRCLTTQAKLFKGLRVSDLRCSACLSASTNSKWSSISRTDYLASITGLDIDLRY